MTPRRATRLLAGALLCTALAGAAPSPGRAATVPSLGPASAPAFRVRDLSGQTRELSALLARGPVLLDFWATWCQPCRASIPELSALHERYAARGLTILGVSVDGPRNIAKVRPFVARTRMSYPVVLDDDGRLQQLYQVTQMPTAVLIARDGTVAATRVGFRPGETALAERIESLLATAPADSSAR